jgi:hypothetical protein
MPGSSSLVGLAGVRVRLAARPVHEQQCDLVPGGRGARGLLKENYSVIGSNSFPWRGQLRRGEAGARGASWPDLASVSDKGSNP